MRSSWRSRVDRVTDRCVPRGDARCGVQGNFMDRVHGIPAKTDRRTTASQDSRVQDHQSALRRRSAGHSAQPTVSAAPRLRELVPCARSTLRPAHFARPLPPPATPCLRRGVVAESPTDTPRLRLSALCRVPTTGDPRGPDPVGPPFHRHRAPTVGPPFRPAHGRKDSGQADSDAGSRATVLPSGVRTTPRAAAMPLRLASRHGSPTPPLRSSPCNL
ncbi:hypothetical protein GUJ93_ZPchr0001g32839 [Zizania palustris]|uniref:Uncharacterized protein n=1 Tax=Zizania palustris TaxID=103762 RepID=A0A8J5RUW1_ZIZPA|nr:hypothetical protein GUJ93_ZPchr0001g32839 [Zizania palustris]